MKQEYIVDNQYLAENYGLDLNNYIVDSATIPLYIKIAFEKCVSRILFLNDRFYYESSIEKALDKEPDLLPAFKKLQFQVIYNLTFLGDENPINFEVDEIICSDLKWGKVNGYQKHIYRK